MMMAHDSTPNRPELTAASVEALRSALREYLEYSNETSALQSALRLIATEARAKKMHAEQLLVILKDVWFALPQIGQARESELQNRLLQRVVTLCIREYYST
jgi:hypothetical protein